VFAGRAQTGDAANWGGLKKQRYTQDQPQDDSEVFAAKVEQTGEDDPVAEALQGGAFAGREYVGPIDRCL